MEYSIQQQLKQKEHFLLNSLKLALLYTKPEEDITRKKKNYHPKIITNRDPKIQNKIFASESKHVRKNYMLSEQYTREAK